MQINRTTFLEAQINDAKNCSFTYNSKLLKKTRYYDLFSFNVIVEYIQLYNFRLWNCWWTGNAQEPVVRKIFPFQMSGETSIFTLQGKIHLDKNVKMMFRVAV